MVNKFLQLLFVLFICASMQAQVTYSDDFEAYNAGSTVVTNNSTNWRTWGSTTGGAADDAYITEEAAASGTKSIKIEATVADGGPEDLILKLNNANVNKGLVDVSFNLLVVKGKSGYFNFQSTTTPGTGWAMEFFINNDGTIDVSSNSKAFSNQLTYTPDKWFNFRAVIDATNNLWQIYIDGECKATYRSGLASVASIDFFAASGSKYYIDDVVLNTDPAANTAFEGVEAGLMNFNATQGIQIAGTDIKTSVLLYNVGKDTITSIEYTLSGNNGTETEELTGLNIAPKKSFTIDIPNEVTLADGNNSITLTLNKVNGKDDELTCNNTVEASFSAVKPADHRKVLLEEGTGTWCGWCPRGAVFLKAISPAYDDYMIPIAVHNGDPMVVKTYDNEVTSFSGFTGFPGMIVDRRIVVDPSAALAPGLTYLRETPDATLSIGAKEPDDDGNMEISVSVDYLQATPKGYSMILTIVEDQVKGTTAQYNQANYYSGGNSGAMGGYENLPNPVPAAQMVYEHVARSHDHAVKNMAATEVGEKVVKNYTVKLDPTWKKDDIKIVAVLLNSSNQVSNANDESIEDAVENGFVTSSTEKILVNTNINIYPNPTGDQTSVSLNVQNPSNVSATLIDALGRVVLTKDFGKQQGTVRMNLDVKGFAPGAYTVLIRTQDGIATSKLIIK